MGTAFICVRGFVESALCVAQAFRPAEFGAQKKPYLYRLLIKPKSGGAGIYACGQVIEEGLGLQALWYINLIFRILLNR
jgi:hypothetical protein